MANRLRPLSISLCVFVHGCTRGVYDLSERLFCGFGRLAFCLLDCDNARQVGNICAGSVSVFSGCMKSNLQVPCKLYSPFHFDVIASCERCKDYQGCV